MVQIPTTMARQVGNGKGVNNEFHVAYIKVWTSSVSLLIASVYIFVSSVQELQYVEQKIV